MAVKVFFSHQQADSGLARKIAAYFRVRHDIDSYLDLLDPVASKTGAEPRRTSPTPTWSVHAVDGGGVRSLLRLMVSLTRDGGGLPSAAVDLNPKILHLAERVEVPDLDVNREASLDGLPWRLAGDLDSRDIQGLKDGPVLP